MKYEAHFIKITQPDDEPISTIPLLATEEKMAIEEFEKTYGLDNKNTSNNEVIWKLMCMSEDNESVDYEVIY